MKRSRCRYRTSLAGFATALLLAVSAEAAVTVTSTADAGGSCPGANCTLRQAIATAVSGDTITFSLPANSAITLTSAVLLISKNLTINGPGANLLSIQRSAAPDTPVFPIFYIDDANIVNISGLTIANGRATGDFPLNSGGAIRNSLGTLTISNSTISGNRAHSGAGGILNDRGTVTIINSTISGNSTFRRRGGGLVNYAGSMTITNSTISGNVSENGVDFGEGQGGGVYNQDGTVTMTNSTISDNTAISGGGGGVFNEGGSQGGPVISRNTIIAQNIVTAGGSNPDFSGTLTSNGYNLIGNTTGTTIVTGATGTTTGNQLNVNPMLDTLKDNGGPTFTHAPLNGSKAIDQGHASGSTTDQRGQPRPTDRSEANAAGGDGSDIGAVEVGGLPQTGPTYTVTTKLEAIVGGCTTDDCTLVEALNETNKFTDANTINFVPGLQESIGTATLTPSGLAITNPVTINGPGPRTLGVSGRGSARVFRVTSPNVTISGLSIISGKVTDADGAMIHNTGGLTLTDCIVSNGFAAGATGDGGGIYNGPGASLTLNRCTVSGSSAGRAGGGIFNEGMVAATNCTFSEDSAIQGGGIYSAFSNNASKVTLRNCTITKCSATDAGTGMGDGGGGFYAVGNSGQYNLGNSIIAGNTAVRNPDLRGQFFSDGHNLIRDVGFSSGFDPMKGDQVGTFGSPKEALLVTTLANNGGPTDTHALQSGSTARDSGDDALAPPADQRGYGRSGVSDIGAFEFNGIAPGLVANVSTRLQVGQDDDALFEGFIIQGPAGSSKKIIVRALGPFLASCCGVTDALANPTLGIFQGNNQIATNNDWGTTQLGGIITADQSTEIAMSGFAPSDGLESVIIANLAPGAYTAVARGLGNTTGIGLVDAFDLSASSLAKVVNFATRGLVQPGQKLLTAGFIIQNGPVRAVIRAIGPSLTGPPFNITNALPDTTLQLRNQNGDLVQENDDWESDQRQELVDTGLQPTNPKEAALVRTIPPGQYTAQVRGKPEGTGTGVVEIYFIQ